MPSFMSDVAAQRPKSVASKTRPSESGISRPRRTASSDVAAGDRAVGEDGPRHLLGRGERLPGGNDPVHEADPIGLRGVDLLGRQTELHRPSFADEPRQPLGAAVSGDDSELDLGLSEPGVLGSDADRAAERELAAAAERIPVDGRDDRLAEALELPDDRLSAAGMLAALDGARASRARRCRRPR